MFRCRNHTRIEAGLVLPILTGDSDKIPIERFLRVARIPLEVMKKEWLPY